MHATMRLPAFALALLVTLAPASGRAEGWQTIAGDGGPGAAVCNDDGDTGNYDCLAFRCAADRGVEFAFLFAGGRLEERFTADLAIDGQPVARLTFRSIDPTAEYVAPYAPARHARLLEALRTGRELTMTVVRRHIWSLIDGQSALAQAIATCSARQ